MRGNVVEFYFIQKKMRAREITDLQEESYGLESGRARNGTPVTLQQD